MTALTVSSRCRLLSRGILAIALPTLIAVASVRSAPPADCAPCAATRSVAIVPADSPDDPEPYEILTPPPGPEPRINGPSLQGARPGHPFLYRIPCTGNRPIHFTAEALPDPLHLDPLTGIITGQTPDTPGRYSVVLRATNPHGAAERSLTIVAGDTLALTPPMGFNDWYTWYDRITQADMQTAANALISTGMADFGYQFVNIDDCWMVKPGSDDPELGGEPRDAHGAIRPNARFPDMKALADSIHALGLKAGLYSSPGPLTCAGFAGSFQHEAADARQFAAWGFDFLKYDWCSYGKVATGEGLSRLQRPYTLMGDILRSLDRDIQLNLCQYGMGDVWTWGADVGGQSWRTTGDLGLEPADHLPGFYRIGLKNAQLADFAGPGRWNDPDYILIGQVGNAHEINQPPQPTSLTPNEQYSYMSMWCLMAAPLFYSGDITRLDPFTRNILCNAEVIAIDQDPHGRQARIIRQTDDELILAKPLEDGSLAVGLFNLSETPRPISLDPSELSLVGEHRARDLWRERDLGPFTPAPRTIPRHGVTLLRLHPNP